MIRVRFATGADLPQLVAFIHDHWSASHIFVEHPDVFSWQHLQHDDRFNMVLAEDDTAAERAVLGVLGFIPMGRFSPPLGDTDLMLAIWKVRDGGPPGLGLRLLKFLDAELSPRLIAAIGTSKMVRRIYEVLSYQVGSMHHVALFNPECADSHRIAAGVPAEAFVVAGPVSSTVLDVVAIDEAIDRNLRTAIDHFAAAQVPAKDWDYLVARYLRHPWYTYQLRAIIHHGVPTAVVVWRIVPTGDACLLRIVDIVGDVRWLEDAAAALQTATMQAGAEYVDLVYWGIDSKLLIEGGWVSPAQYPELVLPNYFSPFEQRNVDIEMAYKVSDANDGSVRLFRADSDQDRPNRSADVAPPA